MLMRPDLGPVMLVFAGCLALGGCGAKIQAGASNPVAATLQFSNSTLAFGNVSVGSSKRSILTITNSSGAGGPGVTVSQIAIAGAGFAAAPSSAPPFTLSPGQSSTIAITFAPKSGGTVNGDLSIMVGSNTASSLPLSGNGLAASQLAASLSSMNFGNVAVGSSKSQNGSLTTGSSNITVSSAAWNGSGFSLTGITFPVTVPPGQSMPFTVTFAPQISGSATGQVSFVSDASNSPTVVTLAGSGTQAAQHSVSLSWNASTSLPLGYNVYRGTNSGGPYTKLNSSLISGLSFADNNVQSGATYYYVATSVDSSNLESGYSNLATAIIP
jgi:hypothetical protein